MTFSLQINDKENAVAWLNIDAMDHAFDASHQERCEASSDDNLFSATRLKDYNFAAQVHEGDREVVITNSSPALQSGIGENDKEDISMNPSDSVSRLISRKNFSTYFLDANAFGCCATERCYFCKPLQC